MSRPVETPQLSEPFGEKDFYLEELRGRSVLVAIAPEVACQRTDSSPLTRAVADLVRNGTRVLIWWPASGVAAERRLTAALARARAWVRGRGVRKRPAPLVRHDASPTGPEDHATLRAALWERLRRGGLCVLAVRGPALFPEAALGLAVALRVPKVVLVDGRGGLAAGGSARLSFVDENLLETLLRRGEAEWSGLGDRHALLVAVGDAIDRGVESVNLCTLAEVGDELFTYEGAGTLFTEGDYCRVGPLGLDDFAQAERLLERGQREGLLKLRTSEEVGEVLAAGVGATICGRHLAGVAGLLSAPYAAEEAGEIVGLYTIMRFKGEGIGERLVAYLLAEARARRLRYVFACAVDARAQEFFARQGFARVGPGDVPASKWVGYDARRRARVAVFRRDVAESTPR